MTQQIWPFLFRCLNMPSLASTFGLNVFALGTLILHLKCTLNSSLLPLSQSVKNLVPRFY